MDNSAWPQHQQHIIHPLYFRNRSRDKSSRRHKIGAINISIQRRSTLRRLQQQQLYPQSQEDHSQQNQEHIDDIFTPQDSYHEANSSMIGYSGSNPSDRWSKQELQETEGSKSNEKTIDSDILTVAMSKQDLASDHANCVDRSVSKEELISNNTLDSTSTTIPKSKEMKILPPSDVDKPKAIDYCFKEEINRVNVRKEWRKYRKALFSLQSRRVNKPDARAYRLPEIQTTTSASKPFTPILKEVDNQFQSIKDDSMAYTKLEISGVKPIPDMVCESMQTKAPTTTAICGLVASMAPADIDSLQDNTDYQLQVSEKDRVVVDRILTELSTPQSFKSGEIMVKHLDGDDPKSPSRLCTKTSTEGGAIIDIHEKQENESATLVATVVAGNNSESMPEAAAAPPLPDLKIQLPITAGSNAFTIEPSAPEMMDVGENKRFEKRSHAFQELITTEQSYINDLDVLVHVHLRVLESKSWFPHSVHSNMLRCVMGLLTIHRKFLSQIQVYNTNEADNDKRTPLKVYRALETSFKVLGQDHKLYTQFCELRMRAINEINRAVGQSIMTGLQKESKELMAQQGRPKSRTDLKDHLIKPIQRICRYPLLLKEILRLTGSGEPEYEFIYQAHEYMRTLALQMDETQKNVERQLLTEQFLKKLPETNFPRKSGAHSVSSLMHSSGTNESYHNYHHQTSGLHPLNSANNLHPHEPPDILFEGGPLGEGILPGALTKSYASTLGSIILAGALEYVIIPDMPIRLRYYGCFLFESMLIIVKAKKMSLYEPRQWLPLRLCELYETTRLDGYTRYGWRIMYDQFRIDFGASCEAERQAWITALQKHIHAAKMAHGRLSRDTAALEPVISSLPWNMARPHPPPHLNSTLQHSSSTGSLTGSGLSRQVQFYHHPPSPTPSPWSACSSAIPSPLMPPPPMATSSTSTTMMMAMSFITNTGEPEKWNDCGTPGISLDAYAQYYDQHIHPHVPDTSSLDQCVQSMFKDVSTENIWTTTTTATAAANNTHHPQSTPQPLPTGSLSTSLTSRPGRHSTPLQFNYFASSSSTSNYLGGSTALLPPMSPKVPIGTAVTNGTSITTSVVGGVSLGEECDRKRTSGTTTFAATLALNFRKNSDPSTHGSHSHCLATSSLANSQGWGHRRRLSIPDPVAFFNNNYHTSNGNAEHSTSTRNEVSQQASGKRRVETTDNRGIRMHGGMTASFASSPSLATFRNKTKKNGMAPALGSGNLKSSQSSQDLAIDFVASSTPLTSAIGAGEGETTIYSIPNDDLDQEILNRLSSAAADVARSRREGRGCISERNQRQSLGPSLTMTNIHSLSAGNNNSIPLTAITTELMPSSSELKSSPSTITMPIHLEPNISSSHTPLNSPAPTDYAPRDTVEKIRIAMGRLTHKRSSINGVNGKASSGSNHSCSSQHQGSANSPNSNYMDLIESSCPLRQSSIHTCDSHLTPIISSPSSTSIHSNETFSQTSDRRSSTASNMSSRNHYRTVSESTVHSVDSATSQISGRSTSVHNRGILGGVISSSPSSVPQLTLMPLGSTRSRVSSSSSAHSNLLSVYDHSNIMNDHPYHNRDSKFEEQCHPSVRETFSEDHHQFEEIEHANRKDIGTISPRSLSHHSGSSSQSTSSASAISFSRTMHRCNDHQMSSQPQLTTLQGSNHVRCKTDNSSSGAISSTSSLISTLSYDGNSSTQTLHLDSRPNDRRKHLSILQNISQASQKFRTLIRSPTSGIGARRKTAMNLSPMTMDCTNSEDVTVVASEAVNVSRKDDEYGTKTIVDDKVNNGILGSTIGNGWVDEKPLVSDQDINKIFGTTDSLPSLVANNIS
ncbi:hypothetical protein FBU30_005665 [Linnemannia zychae]|nr:hypothetical protein FBU30_005665 [Linnemannia zychae]